MADAQRWAASQAEAGDALAGQLWIDVGVEHVDSGRLVVGDASAALTEPLVDRLREPGETRKLPRTWNLPFVRFGTGGDWPVAVESAPADGQIIALRFIVDDDPPPEGAVIAYGDVGTIDIAPPGQVRMSDPAYLHEMPGRVVDVRPGHWVAEEVLAGDRVTGLRLRHANPFDPDPFAGAGGVDREQAAYAVAESLDWDTGNTASPVRSCLLDLRSRIAVVTMKAEAVYELAIAFGTTPLIGLADAHDDLKAIADELLRVQSDDDRTIDDVRVEGLIAAVDLTAGATITMGLRRRTAAVPVVGAFAFRHPSDMHGELQSCPACGGSVWPVSYGMPSFDDFISGHVGQRNFGGCVIDPLEPEAICHDCGWRQRVLLDSYLRWSE